MKTFSIQIFVTLLMNVILFGITESASAQQNSPPPPALPKTETKPSAFVLPGQQGIRRALIICGHPGDDDHQAMYAKTIADLQKTLIENYNFPTDEIRVLSGTGEDEDDTAVVLKTQKPATREEILAQVTELKKVLEPDDSLWVIVLGHAHYDGGRAWLNLPGPDLHEYDFRDIFEDIPCREQVFFMTTSVSGFFIKPLSRKGRVVISATEADREVNETVFHESLANVLESLPTKKENDLNQDGFVSLFELYIAVTRSIAQSYVDDELLSTEHALLDDNGDGRGTELQIDYLTEEQGGRATETSKPPGIQPKTDGYQADSLKLAPVVIPKPEPKTQKKETKVANR